MVTAKIERQLHYHIAADEQRRLRYVSLIARALGRVAMGDPRPPDREHHAGELALAGMDSVHVAHADMVRRAAADAAGNPEALGVCLLPAAMDAYQEALGGACHKQASKGKRGVRCAIQVEAEN